MAPLFLWDNLRTRRPGVRIPHGVPNRESVGLQQIPDFPFVYKGFRRFGGAADVTLLWAIMGYSGFKLHMNCPFPENAQKMLAKPARM